MTKQVLVIHGGDTFKTYEEYLQYLKVRPVDLGSLKKQNWQVNLQADLGNGYEVITPKMPNKNNAHYLEWQIWLEKIIPLLDPMVTLVGSSLGGIFLVKYLAENKFPKQIDSLHLVAAPFDDEGSDYTLGDFALPSDLTSAAEQAKQVIIYQSTDDPVALPLNATKYQQAFPTAILKMFSDRQHFKQDHFPELVEMLRR